jgi:hypothetical protein
MKLDGLRFRAFAVYELALADYDVLIRTFCIDLDNRAAT